MIEVLKTKDKESNFVIKSKSGKVILKSVVFENQAHVKKTIELLSSLTKLTNYVERKTNVDGKFLFSLKNKDGQIVGHSGLYSSEAGMENGIKNLENLLVEL